MEPAANVPLKQNEWYLEPAYPGVVCKDYPDDVVKVGLRGSYMKILTAKKRIGEDSYAAATRRVEEEEANAAYCAH